VIILAGDKDTKIGIINGKDSACGSIAGPVASFTISENFEFIAGGYNTNFKKFNDIGINPTSISGITPILGLDFRIPIYENNKIRITIDNLISLGILTHSLRVDF
jgi:hypothetical protein